MVTYRDKETDLTTVYLIEYIDNQRDLDYVNSGRLDKGEPWERYKTNHSMTSALHFLFTWLCMFATIS